MEGRLEGRLVDRMEGPRAGHSVVQKEALMEVPKVDRSVALRVDRMEVPKEGRSEDQREVLMGAQKEDRSEDRMEALRVDRSGARLEVPRVARSEDRMGEELGRMAEPAGALPPLLVGGVEVLQRFPLRVRVGPRAVLPEPRARALPKPQARELPAWKEAVRAGGQRLGLPRVQEELPRLASGLEKEEDRLRR